MDWHLHFLLKIEMRMGTVNYSNNRSLKLNFLSILACCATLATGVATAQDDQVDSIAGLEEVIVTATKRSESIQEVGMSTTAFGNAELYRMGTYEFRSSVFSEWQRVSCD